MEAAELWIIILVFQFFTASLETATADPARIASEIGQDEPDIASAYSSARSLGPFQFSFNNSNNHRLEAHNLQPIEITIN